MGNKEFFKIFQMFCLLKRFPFFNLNRIVILPGSNTARVAEYDAPDTTPAPPTEKFELIPNIAI